MKDYPPPSAFPAELALFLFEKLLPDRTTLNHEAVATLIAAAERAADHLPPDDQLPSQDQLANADACVNAELLALGYEGPINHTALTALRIFGSRFARMFATRPGCLEQMLVCSYPDGDDYVAW